MKKIFLEGLFKFQLEQIGRSLNHEFKKRTKQALIDELMNYSYKKLVNALN